VREACIQCAQLFFASVETGDGSDVTGFGSFDNSTCKRVLDLLEPRDLRLGQVVITRVAVVKLGVNSGSGDCGSCFCIEVHVWTDIAKLRDMVITRFEDRCDLVTKSEVFIKYEAKVSVVSEELLI